MSSINEIFSGRQLKNDLFSPSGVFVLPAMTTLTPDKLRTLEMHRITLEEKELLPSGGSAEEIQRAVDEATERMEHIFLQIRADRRVPLAELKEQVIPLVNEVADSGNFYRILTALQSKDDYTYRHGLAVGILSTLLGRWMKLPPGALRRLTIAATLHDIGKIIVPSHILNKEGPLTPEEFEEMKEHTTYGYQIITDTPGASHEMALVALQHHERLDGGGYPFGLQGHRITEFARIVAVTDIFHAMCSDRVYRSASPLYEVLRQMRDSIFGELDPLACNLFLDKIMQSMIGNDVDLTDGSRGTIIMSLAHDPLRPLVLRNGDFIDLSSKRELDIVRVLPV